MSHTPTNRTVDRRMRSKQLASAVRQGRKITIQVIDDYPFAGYLCGWDDETYFMIIPSAPSMTGKERPPPVKRLIPKSSIQWIDIAEDRSFQEEECYDQMVGTVQPFKDWINATYFEESNAKAA
jgi:hypothetical protein